MSSGGDFEHSVTTRRSEFRYLFTAKHHGGGASNVARWHPSVSRDEEFGVFDAADWNEIRDGDGDYYGVLRDGTSGLLRSLGTWNQQLAKFPATPFGQPWHGYPLMPIEPDENIEVHRRGRQVPREVWRLLQGANPHGAVLLTREEASKLKKGKLA
jgi:hypothetical protein